MPDDTGWRDQIRPHLTSLRLEPPREEEIVEEISQHLDERYQEVLLAGMSPPRARQMALDELLEADAFIAAMRGLRQAQTRQRQPANTAGTSSRRYMSGSPSVLARIDEGPRLRCRGRVRSPDFNRRSSRKGASTRTS